MPPLPDPERLSYYRIHDVPGVEVLSAENCSRRWCVYHQTCDICTVVDDGRRGRSEWSYRGASHAVSAGSVAVFEPGEIHRTTRITGSGSFHVLMVDPALVRNLAVEAGVGAMPHFRSSATTRPEVFNAFASFHFLAAEAAGTTLEVQSRFVSCLVAAMLNCGEARVRPPAPATRRALEGARELIHARCNENIALDDLARAAGLSRFHFLRSFARHFGLPPHAYQIRLRIETVRGLLRAGVPLQEIDAGFADQSHLIRHFKHVLGVTPQQYAVMVRHRFCGGAALPLLVPQQ